MHLISRICSIYYPIIICPIPECCIPCILGILYRRKRKFTSYSLYDILETIQYSRRSDRHVNWIILSINSRIN